jgi:hypothetical protein
MRKNIYRKDIRKKMERKAYDSWKEKKQFIGQTTQIFNSKDNIMSYADDSRSFEEMCR